MEHSLSTSACRRIAAVAALTAGLTAGSSAVSVAVASDAMPVAQQNALVLKHCAVCHNDAHKQGGLSLEHFDAAHPDPSVAAMMLSKVRDGGAMSAASIPMPDKTTQDALVSALTAEAIGASAWTVNRTQNLTTQAPILTASIVREVPSRIDVYRLTLTCHVDTHEGEMQLAWAPRDVPQGSWRYHTGGATFSAAVDGKMPFTYNVDNGEGAAVLYTATESAGVIKLPLPAQTLTISNLFPDQTVVFPFDSLTQAARHELSTCFTGSSISQ